MNTYKIFIPIILMLICSTSFALSSKTTLKELMLEQNKKMDRAGGELTVDETLYGISQIINQKLPAMVDHHTRLDTTSTANKRFTYYFTLVNVDKDQVDAYKFMVNMRNQIGEPVCQSEQLQPFFDNDYPVYYRYHDAYGKMFANIIITKNDCLR